MALLHAPFYAHVLGCCFGCGTFLGWICYQLRGRTLIAFKALETPSTAAADSCLPNLEISPSVNIRFVEVDVSLYFLCCNDDNNKSFCFILIDLLYYFT